MISPVLRPKLWSALLGAVAAAVLATPAYAEPGRCPTTVPGHRLPPGGRRLRFSCPACRAGRPAARPPGGVTIGNGPLAAADLRRRGPGRRARRRRCSSSGRNASRRRRSSPPPAQALATGPGRPAPGPAGGRHRRRRGASRPPPRCRPATSPPDLRGLNRPPADHPGRARSTAAPPRVAGELARARAAEQVAYQAHAAAKAGSPPAAAEYTAGRDGAPHRQEARLLKLRRDNAAAADRDRAPAGGRRAADRRRLRLQPEHQRHGRRTRGRWPRSGTRSPSSATRTSGRRRGRTGSTAPA